MNTNIKIALAGITCAALGATAMQELHAQAKPKAYTITESELLDAAALAAYSPLIQAAVTAAGGRRVHLVGGKVVAIEGAAPKRVAINEWGSVEQAQAFSASKAYKDLAPQRDKATKTIRRYAVEVGN